MAFPKYIFVTEHKEADGSKWFAVSTDQIDAVEGEKDDVVTVAHYQRLKTNNWRVVKSLVLAEKPK